MRKKERAWISITKAHEKNFVIGLFRSRRDVKPAITKGKQGLKDDRERKFDFSSNRTETDRKKMVNE